MGPQRGQGPISDGSEMQWVRSDGLLAVGSIEFLDHLVG